MHASEGKYEWHNELVSKATAVRQIRDLSRPRQHLPQQKQHVESQLHVGFQWHADPQLRAYPQQQDKQGQEPKVESSQQQEQQQQHPHCGFDIFLNLCDGAFDEDRAGVEVVDALER